MGTASLASVQHFRADFFLCFWNNFCVSGAALKDFFVLFFALSGTLLINKWKLLHLKSGGITDPSELLNPQQAEGRCAKITGEDHAVLMKLNWFPLLILETLWWLAGLM